MDALADWWVHEVGVRRLTGSGAGGDVFTPAPPAAPAALTGLWDDGTQLVRDENGQEVVSTARFAHPASDARVPAGSQVTAPTEFGGGVRTVIKCALGDAGGMPVPSHYELSLK